MSIVADADAATCELMDLVVGTDFADGETWYQVLRVLEHLRSLACDARDLAHRTAVCQ